MTGYCDRCHEQACMCDEIDGVWPPRVTYDYMRPNGGLVCEYVIRGEPHEVQREVQEIERCQRVAGEARDAEERIGKLFKHWSETDGWTKHSEFLSLETKINEILLPLREELGG